MKTEILGSQRVSMKGSLKCNLLFSLLAFNAVHVYLNFHIYMYIHIHFYVDVT